MSFNRDCGAESWLLHTTQHTHTHNKKMLTGHLQEAAEQDIPHAHTHSSRKPDPTCVFVRVSEWVICK